VQPAADPSSPSLETTVALPRTVLNRALAHVHRRDAGASGASQTLTVQRPTDQVFAALRDPAVLTRLLGDLGHVSAQGSRYSWTLGEEGVSTVLAETTDGLRFARTGPDGVAEPEDDTEGGAERAVDLFAEFTVTPTRDGTGSEVRARSQLPGGTADFTFLYRLRALLQTGEIPTLGPQPTTREEDR
jgi:carbon monoxide dehydrogenase subunit G